MIKQIADFEITEAELLKLAELSKLDISKNDPNYYNIIKNLNNIINFVKQLDNLDIANIEPMLRPDYLNHQKLRLDIITEVNDRNNLQHIAPANKIESGLYLVPKVIDEIN